MKIRLATPDDLQFTDEVFAAACERMRAEGNTQQWVNGYPSHEVILRDISRGEGYIIEAQGCVSGYFCLQHGLEPTYAQIRGEWPSEGPYLTIHRAAARIAGLHIFPAIISFASRYGLTLRADTHAQNKTMQRLLLRHGFRYCGEITLSDGSPRLAYQLDE